MNKKSKEFKLHKKQPIFNFVKAILKLFMKKPKKIINLAGELNSKAILVSNHSGKKGPAYLELYFPLYHYVWGAGEMLGNYSSRFHYLRDVFYMQKKGLGKFKATIMASFEAIFSIYFYKGLKVLPTFTTGKLLPTINKSVKVLDQNAGVLIFPENSSKGYFDELTEFFPGFVLLSQVYYNKTGEDVPVYPVYYHIKERILCIGKPLYVHEFVKKGLTRTEVAEIFRQKVNHLYLTYCNNNKR